MTKIHTEKTASQLTKQATDNRKLVAQILHFPLNISKHGLLRAQNLSCCLSLTNHIIYLHNGESIIKMWMMRINEAFIHKRTNFQEGLIIFEIYLRIQCRMVNKLFRVHLCPKKIIMHRTSASKSQISQEFMLSSFEANKKSRSQTERA